MLTDPTQALQAAISDLLLGNADVASLVDDRVFDRIPSTPEFPYVSFGEFQVLPELAEGTDAVQCFVTLHSWDRFKSSRATKGLARAIIATLHDRDLTIDGGAVQSLLLQSSRVLQDPDGLTSHGILVFEILTDANIT
jgi:hypothetical protein